MLFANKHSFVSIFPNCMTFTYFPCLIALAEASSVYCWIGIMRVDIPALIPNLKGKHSVLLFVGFFVLFEHGFSYFDSSYSKGQKTSVRVLQTDLHSRNTEMATRWVHKPNGSLWDKHELGIFLLPGSCSSYFDCGSWWHFLLPGIRDSSYPTCFQKHLVHAYLANDWIPLRKDWRITTV